MRTTSGPLNISIRAADVPPPSGDKMVYDGQFPPGTAYMYAFSSSQDFDDFGHYLWGGAPTHEAYNDINRNAINWWTPPAIGAQGDGVAEVLFPRQPKKGWVATDEFIRWYIPGYEWWMQQWQVIFDLKTRTILASNIAALQQAAGDPVEPIPPMESMIEKVGNLADNMGFAPYEPAHAWSREHDVGVTIGGSHTHDKGICMTKQAGPKPLRIKVWYLPLAAKHPLYGWPCKAMRRGAAVGDWFYVFGTQWSVPTLPGVLELPPFNVRFHIPSIVACPPHGRLPDSAMEVLPSTPYLWPAGGAGYMFESQITHDTARGTLIDWNHRVVEIKVADSVADFEYRDVTPDGYPTCGQYIGGYDRVTNAHYMANGFTPSYGASCLNLVRPRVNATTTSIGQPDPAVPLSDGDPPFMNTTRFHRFRFPD